MGLSKIGSATFLGLDALLVDVEVDVESSDQLSLIIVGLPDAAVKESKDRVLTSIKNSGFPLKNIRCTVNLAPGDLKKEGPLYDLPIALGILEAQKLIPPSLLDKYLVIGELGLSGETRSIHGALGVALLAQSLGKEGIILPVRNYAEASVVDGIKVIPVAHLKEAVLYLNHPNKIQIPELEKTASIHSSKALFDFSEVKGQAHAKRALELAAAGFHNILLSGPPGSGKTMLAKALTGIMPPLSLQESLEVTKIHSIAGMLPEGKHLISNRPFRSPHHTISYAGLIGGGNIPRPGEVSLAHHGILFLDELPEFSRHALEVLRQPLEDRKVTISRAQAKLTFPTLFLCVAAMNPCPCGYLGHPDKPCSDTEAQIQRYRGKISGPLLDRIDMHIEVPALRYADFSAPSNEENSETIRKRVEEARQIQTNRFGKQYTNSQMTPAELRHHCVLNEGCKQLMRQAVDVMGISVRAHDRILRVSRTIADLAGSFQIHEDHLMEAIHYRQSALQR